MQRKTKRLRDEIRETLAALAEAMEPARSLQTKLLVLQREAMASRKVELDAATAAMRAPRPRTPEAVAEASLVVDALDAIAKTFAGIGIAKAVVRGIEEEASQAKVSPQQRKDSENASRQKLADAYKLGAVNRRRLESGLKPLDSLDEVDALRELAVGATP